MNGFAQVFDRKGRRVRGLWQRNGHYYAQLNIHGVPTRVHLNADTVAAAQMRMQAERVRLSEGVLPVTSRGCAFIELANRYESLLEHSKNKTPATVKREKSCLAQLKAYFKDRPVAKIGPQCAQEYAIWRINGQNRKVSGRAVDVDLVVLRSVLRRGVMDRVIHALPAGEWPVFADPPRKIGLLSRSDIAKLVWAARKIQRTGRAIANYLLFLAYSGCREQEALKMRWSINVDLARRKLAVGLDGKSKYGKTRFVDINASLARLLSRMKRRAESDWLFESNRRKHDGKRVIRTHTTNYRKGFHTSSERAGFSGLGFHHFRHFFISQAVMAGVDYMTIASWVGHADGGVLIGKVYGHLARGHAEKMAAKLNFRS